MITDFKKIDRSKLLTFISRDCNPYDPTLEIISSHLLKEEQTCKF